MLFKNRDVIRRAVCSGDASDGSSADAPNVFAQHANRQDHADQCQRPILDVSVRKRAVVDLTLKIGGQLVECPLARATPIGKEALDHPAIQ